MRSIRACSSGPIWAHLWLLSAFCIALALTACTTPRSSGTSSTTRAAAPHPAAPVNIVLSTAPWTFNTKPGEIITTPHYRVYCTDTRPTTLDRLPMFLEAALEHYRTALTGPPAPLPYPELRMETFILDTRPDWEMLTKQLLGDQSETFLRIQRGGFAYGGRALLFDIGTHDTMSVAAHEGWHQYTQRAFRQPLPIWLEEGLAAYMEGHRWGGPLGGQPLFFPWANVERFDLLRRAQAQGRLVPLKELLTSSPQSLISAADSGPGLIYYAQVWALAHFLAEGEGGRYRPGLLALLHDAANGRIPETVANVLGPALTKTVRRPIALNVGPVVFLAYFNQNLDEADHQFAAFMTRLVQPGSRGPIVAGISPFIPPAPPSAPAAGLR